jgi:hypoxanthine-guanine phosphoribosyltransferase
VLQRALACVRPQDKDLLVLGVLKGGAVFTADLIRHINPVPQSMELDFFKAAS